MAKQLTDEQILKRQASQKRHYQKTKEARKIYAANYYKKNKERILEQQKEYVLTNAGRATRKRAKRTYYDKNKDSLIAKYKEYYLKRKLAILQGNDL
jgi:hypothetical protein